MVMTIRVHYPSHNRLKRYYYEAGNVNELFLLVCTENDTTHNDKYTTNTYSKQSLSGIF